MGRSNVSRKVLPHTATLVAVAVLAVLVGACTPDPGEPPPPTTTTPTGAGYAGTWSASGDTRRCGIIDGVEVCGDTIGTVADRPFELVGPCDGVDGCAILLQGADWSWGTPEARCMTDTPYGYRIAIGGYPGGIQITLEPSTSGPSLEVVNTFPISASPPVVGVDMLTATRTGPSTIAAPDCLNA